MALLHPCGSGNGHCMVDVSNRKQFWVARRKHQHLQHAGKDHSLGKRDGVGLPQKESETDGQKEREMEGEGGYNDL